MRCLVYHFKHRIKSIYKHVNRLKIIPKEKKTELLEPEFPLKSFESLSIDSEKRSNVYVHTKPNSKSGIAMRSVYSIQREKIDSFFSGLVEEIYTLTTTEKGRDTVYHLFRKIIDEFCLLSTANLEDIDHEIKKLVKTKIAATQQYVSDKIHSFDASYKREKELQACPFYVAPIEKAIGLTWKSKMDVKFGMPHHIIKQPTFQYVPIISTLKSLFSQQEFKKMYFQNCQNPGHVCTDGIYKHFCCSSTCRRYELYRDKTAIRILVGIDDFDPCDAVKSKSVIHKVSGVYFTISNIPDWCLSKLDNMYLVALCEVSNHKQDDSCFDDILALIINEAKELDTAGISVDAKTLKGSIVHVNGDNLGSNGFPGFVECFNSRFCRVCEVTKEESEILTKEDSTKTRTMESYAQCVKEAQKFVDNKKKINMQITKGVKRVCPFNALDNFDVTENITFDIMHDLNEGVIPFLLSNLFNHITEQNILSEKDIQTRVRDFNYGELSKGNKPSIVNLIKKILDKMRHKYTVYLSMFHSYLLI